MSGVNFTPKYFFFRNCWAFREIFSTLLSAFNQKSRKFIDLKTNGDYQAISKISVNGAFSKMDSKAYPLLNLYSPNAETGETFDIISREYLVTRDGNLFFDGVGNIVGPYLHFVATVRQGTGIYQGVQGQIVCESIIGPETVELNYSGSITLAQ
jgi:hypothetical protein